MKYDYPNNLTKEDLKNVFNSKNLLNDNDWQLIKYHYQMPEHRATATQLGKLLNYSKFTAVNLHYARIAKKITEFTGKYPYQGTNGSYRWWSLLSTADEEGTYFP